MSFSFLKYQAVNRKYFIIQSTSALHWALDLQILISNLYKPWDLTKSSPNLIWATFTLYIQRNSFSALWTGHMSQYDLSPTKSHHLFTRWWASVESVFLKDIPWLEVIFNVIRYLHLDPAGPNPSPRLSAQFILRCCSTFFCGNPIHIQRQTLDVKQTNDISSKWLFKYTHATEIVTIVILLSRIFLNVILLSRIFLNVIWKPSGWGRLSYDHQEPTKAIFLFLAQQWKTSPQAKRHKSSLHIISLHFFSLL